MNSELYDLEHLAATTPYPLRDWQDAHRRHSGRWDRVAPVLLAIGGNPRALSRDLSTALLDPFYSDTDRPMSATARRYVEALVAQAATEARINALTELLVEHAYLAEVAETQLAAVDYDDLMPKVWSQAVGEPPLDIVALLDLADGEVYVRPTYNNGEPVPDRWVKAAASLRGATTFEWPIGKAGPFIALSEAGAIERHMREAGRRDTTEDELHRVLGNSDGYRIEGEDYARPSLQDAVSRVLTAKDQKAVRLSTEASDFRDQFETLQRQVTALANTGECASPEQLRALLPAEEVASR